MEYIVNVKPAILTAVILHCAVNKLLVIESEHARLYRRSTLHKCCPRPSLLSIFKILSVSQLERLASKTFCSRWQVMHFRLTVRARQTAVARPVLPVCRNCLSLSYAKKTTIWFFGLQIGIRGWSTLCYSATTVDYQPCDLEGGLRTVKLINHPIQQLYMRTSLVFELTLLTYLPSCQHCVTFSDSMSPKLTLRHRNGVFGLIAI
jgi:hypothetical protein